MERGPLLTYMAACVVTRFTCFPQSAGADCAGLLSRDGVDDRRRRCTVRAASATAGLMVISSPQLCALLFSAARSCRRRSCSAVQRRTRSRLGFCRSVCNICLQSPLSGKGKCRPKGGLFFLLVCATLLVRLYSHGGTARTPHHKLYVYILFCFQAFL